jgi:hypothetical protein
MQMSEHSQVRSCVTLLPLLLAAFSLVGCADNPLSPESGMAVPTEPGT